MKKSNICNTKGYDKYCSYDKLQLFLKLTIDKRNLVKIHDNCYLLKTIFNIFLFIKNNFLFI